MEKNIDKKLEKILNEIIERIDYIEKYLFGIDQNSEEGKKFLDIWLNNRRNFPCG